ncbi:hypothetical protein LIA77_06327 [Sarocladium implicatum]|nr:hypothetical protein LIA77_06327 [Sarocladium implicatum]
MIRETVAKRALDPMSASTIPLYVHVALTVGALLTAGLVAAILCHSMEVTRYLREAKSLQQQPASVSEPRRPPREPVIVITPQTRTSRSKTRSYVSDGPAENGPAQARNVILPGARSNRPPAQYHIVDPRLRSAEGRRRDTVGRPFEENDEGASSRLRRRFSTRMQSQTQVKRLWHRESLVEIDYLDDASRPTPRVRTPSPDLSFRVTSPGPSQF